MSIEIASVYFEKCVFSIIKLYNQINGMLENHNLNIHKQIIDLYEGLFDILC